VGKETTPATPTRARTKPPSKAGHDRVVAFLELRWGRLVRWEDYEDTERVAAWDRQRAAVAGS
jgi:hypothetical protein